MSHYVYRIKDKNDVVVYVGETSDIKARSANHEKAMKGDALECINVFDSCEGKSVEAGLIRYFKPCRNIQIPSLCCSKDTIQDALTSEWVRVKSFEKTSSEILMQIDKNEYMTEAKEYPKAIPYNFIKGRQSTSQVAAQIFVDVESNGGNFKKDSIENTKHTKAHPFDVEMCRVIDEVLGRDVIDRLVSDVDVAIPNKSGSTRNTKSLSLIYKAALRVSNGKNKLTNEIAEEMAVKNIKAACNSAEDIQLYLRFTQEAGMKLLLAMQNRANSIED
jgi:hypothetical protein